MTNARTLFIKATKQALIDVGGKDWQDRPNRDKVIAETKEQAKGIYTKHPFDAWVFESLWERAIVQILNDH